MGAGGVLLVGDAQAHAGGDTGEDAQAAKARVTRELNDEIAHAIANFSGLTD